MNSKRPRNYSPYYNLNLQNANFLLEPELDRAYRDAQDANLNREEIRLQRLRTQILDTQIRLMKSVTLTNANADPKYSHSYGKLTTTDKLDYQREYQKLQEKLLEAADKAVTEFKLSHDYQMFVLARSGSSHTWDYLKRQANYYDCLTTKIEIAKLTLQAQLDSHFFYLRAKSNISKKRLAEFKSDYYYDHYWAHQNWYTTWNIVMLSSILMSTRPYSSVPSSSLLNTKSDAAGAAIILVLLILLILPVWGFWKLWTMAGEDKIKNSTEIKRASMVITAAASFVALMVGGAFIPASFVNGILMGALGVSLSGGVLVFIGVLLAIIIGLSLGCLAYVVGKQIAQHSENSKQFNSIEREYQQNVADNSAVIQPLAPDRMSIEGNNHEFRQWPMWDQVPSAPPLSEMEELPQDEQVMHRANDDGVNNAYTRPPVPL